MEIYHNWHKYKLEDTSHAKMLLKSMLDMQDVELFTDEETKPEEKPCLMEDDTLEAIKEYEEYQKSLREPYWESLAKMCKDHDKAMEIPDKVVHEYHPDFLLWEDAVTTSLNQVIKRLNK